MRCFERQNHKQRNYAMRESRMFISSCTTPNYFNRASFNYLFCCFVSTIAICLCYFTSSIKKREFILTFAEGQAKNRTLFGVFLRFLLLGRVPLSIVRMRSTLSITHPDSSLNSMNTLKGGTNSPALNQLILSHNLCCCVTSTLKVVFFVAAHLPHGRIACAKFSLALQPKRRSEGYG